MLLRLPMPILIYLLRKYSAKKEIRDMQEEDIADSVKKKREQDVFIDLTLHLQIYSFLWIIDET